MMTTMMHVYMIVIAIVVACLFRILSADTCRQKLGRYLLHPAWHKQRQSKPRERGQQCTHQTRAYAEGSGACADNSYKDFQYRDFQRRWLKTLIIFLVPPVFLLTTALAVVIMGPSSCHAFEGWLSYCLASGFLMLAGLSWIYIGWSGFTFQRTVLRAPSRVIETSFGSVVSHVLDVPAVFSAQIGCWNPTLVVSSALVRQLDEEHLFAVLAHEVGHVYYRDTFWFLWLGGFRRLTFWLPGTESLWQELLLLRELRADRWATQYVDNLVLAESLMNVVSSPLAAPLFTVTTAASFSCPLSTDRLSQRVDAILAEEPASVSVNSYVRGSRRLTDWFSLCISLSWSLTPLMTIPLHH